MFYQNILIILSLLLYLYSFFPIQSSFTDFSNDPPNSIGNLQIDLNETYPRHYRKVALIIIDALRWDFITENNMPTTWSFLHNNNTGGACLSKIRVESPTVTLPRIKALTTGNLPQYSDIIRNLATAALDNSQSDSWLHSAVKNNMKIVFYGDNTWQKLFPNDIFKRSEGTTSFFVYDFDEVDRNVTRNVFVELERKDWHIMILHYLGLDHIGHVYGPFSKLISPKLQEMDDIINKIHTQFSQDNDTLILITGDHGMHDGGGHGGNTLPEITVPLITIGLKCDNKPATFRQTDIPLNLAILLGINIPTTSIGTLQKSLLHKLDLNQYLYALNYNNKLLLEKNRHFAECYDQASHFHEKYITYRSEIYSNLAIQFYENCTRKLTNYLYKTSTRQDMFPLLTSIFLLSYVIMNLIKKLMISNDENNLYIFLICCSIIFVQLYKENIVIFTATTATLLILFLLDLKDVLHFIYNHLIVVRNPLLLVDVIHPFTFVSTSFIEEEHYFWLFITVTFTLMKLLNLLHLKNNKDNLDKVGIFQSIVILILIRMYMDLNSTIENSIKNPENWTNILNRQENFIFNVMVLMFSMIIIYAILYNDDYRKNLYNLLILILISISKIFTFQKIYLSQLIWGLIICENFIFKKFPWYDFWLLVGAFLLRSPNIILLPGAFYIGKLISNSQQIPHVPTLTVACHIMANTFYFLQGHRNSLASLDVSIGFLGLNNYYPVLVFTQMLLHTYIFDILFHSIAMENFVKFKDKREFWLTLLIIRTVIVCFTCFITIIFQNHLFIWSVFAPKLFIESIHTIFLILEISIWNVMNPIYEYAKIN